MKLHNIKRLIAAVGLFILIISLLTGPQQALSCSVPVTGMVTGCESGEEYSHRDGSWTTKYHITVQYMIDGEIYHYSADERTAKIPGSDYLLFADPDAPEYAVSAKTRIIALVPPAAGAAIFAAGIILLIAGRRRA